MSCPSVRPAAAADQNKRYRRADRVQNLFTTAAADAATVVASDMTTAASRTEGERERKRERGGEGGRDGAAEHRFSTASLQAEERLNLFLRRSFYVTYNLLRRIILRLIINLFLHTAL